MTSLPPIASDKSRSLGCIRCKFVVQLDVWAVHRSAEFCEYMEEHFPWIILEYVPGGCTGLWQACDTQMQRILKLSVKRSQLEDSVDKCLTQLKKGVAPEKTVVDNTIGALQDNALVGWCRCTRTSTIPMV